MMSLDPASNRQSNWYHVQKLQFTFFTDVTVNLIQINNFVHTCSKFE